MNRDADEFVRIESFQRLHNGNATRTILTPQSGYILEHHTFLGSLQHSPTLDVCIGNACLIRMSVHLCHVEDDVALAECLAWLNRNQHLLRVVERSLEVDGLWLA